MTDKTWTIHQCQELAKGMDGRISFKVKKPSGGDIDCKWLDPWLGFFTVEGEEGFLMADDFTFNNLQCHSMEAA